MQKRLDPISIAGNYLLTALLVLLSNYAYCQQGYQQFYRHFDRTVRYTSSMRDSCITTYANLLIDIDSAGRVTDVKLSDSAPKEFKQRFTTSKSKLKIELLSDLIQQKGLKNCGLLIPLFYGFEDSRCKNSMEGKYLENKYMSFNTEPYTKLVLALPPIVNIIYKPHQ